MEQNTHGFGTEESDNYRDVFLASPVLTDTQVRAVGKYHLIHINQLINKDCPLFALSCSFFSLHVYSQIGD